MSEKYGTPPFPIRGNLFEGNAGERDSTSTKVIVASLFFRGFALLFLVLFTVFLIAWEKVLGRVCGNWSDRFSALADESGAWTRVQAIIHRFSW